MTYSELILSHSPSNYWKLNESSGLTAADSAGSAPGTISGGVTLAQPGALADGTTAMLFNGTTGKILTPAVSLVTPFTLEGWFQTTSAPERGLFGTRNGGIDGTWFVVTMTATGAIYVFHQVTGGTNATDVGYANGAWHHLVLVVDGTVTVRLYLDGTLRSELAVLSAPWGAGSATHALEIATDSQPPVFFPGGIDEVALYPRALTPTEISDHYAARLVTAVALAGCDHTTVWSRHLSTLAPPKVEVERASLANLYGEPGGTDFSTLVSRWLQEIACGTAVATPAAPTLSTVSPNTGTQGTMVTVTLTGTNFVTGATGVSVNGVGISVVNIHVLSPTSLTADLAIAADAPPTARSITVTTSGGTSSQAFTVAVPPSAWGRIQSAQATVTAAATIAVTLPAPLAVGNGVLVVVASNVGAPSGFAAATCTDSHGHTYLKALGQQDGLAAGSITLFYCPKTTTTGASSTITVAPGAGAVHFMLTVIEVGGVGAGLALDVQSSSGGTSTTITRTTTLPTVNQLLGIGAVLVRSAEASVTVSTPDGMTPGWTEESEALSFGAGGAFAGEADSRALTTATTHSLQATWTWPTSGWFACVVAGFKAT